MGRIVKMLELNDEVIKNNLNSSFFRWAMDNPKICNMVQDLRRLVVYTGNGKVEVDLRQFPESFVNEYFIDKPKLFVDEFVRKLEHIIFNSLSGLGISDFQLDFEFRFFGIYQSRKVKYYMLTRMF